MPRLFGRRQREPRRLEEHAAPAANLRWLWATAAADARLALARDPQALELAFRLPAEEAEAVSELLPELLDARRLREELGVSRATAEAIMRKLEIVQIEGIRKTFVRREDVARLIERSTFSKTEVPA
jgi:hypothetical protein